MVFKPPPGTHAKPEQAKPRGRRRLWFFARLAIALGLLLLILQTKDFDLDAVFRTAVHADPVGVLVLLVGFLVDRYLMAYKWNLLLRSKGIHISHVEAFKIYLTSHFVGFFLPTGVGADVYRGVRLSVARGKAVGVTASIVVERAIGFVAVAVQALLGLFVLLIDGHEQFLDMFFFTLIVLLALLAAIVLSVQPACFRFMKGRLGRYTRFKIVRLYLEFHDAYLDLSRDRSTMFRFSVLSFGEQGLLALLNFLAARAIDVDAGLMYFIALVPLATLATRLPISIGALGVLEWSYLFLFERAGLVAEQVLSLAVLLRVMGLIILIPSGLVFVWEILGSGNRGKASSE